MTMKGSELRRIRELAGFTQDELAEAMGMTRTWLGITERKDETIERRTEYAVRYLAEARCCRSQRLQQVASQIAWQRKEDHVSAEIGDFAIFIRREPGGRWSISLRHPNGFATSVPRWETTLEDAMARAVLHAQLAKLDLHEYQAQLIS